MKKYKQLKEGLEQDAEALHQRESGLSSLLGNIINRRKTDKNLNVTDNTEKEENKNTPKSKTSVLDRGNFKILVE